MLSQSTHTFLQHRNKESELITAYLDHTSRHLPLWCCVTIVHIREVCMGKKKKINPEVSGVLFSKVTNKGDVPECTKELAV